VDNILEIEQLKKYFPVTRGFFRRKVGDIKAIDGVSFTVKKGQTFGLVGESGCGKTTLGRCILQTIPPSSGKIIFEGMKITLGDMKRQNILNTKMQAVFQDPYSSLNPRHRIKSIIAEPLVIQGHYSNREINDRLHMLYDMVGLPEDIGERYPHMLSGGQQQRVGIARAMAVMPDFIVCDEPVSALDVSIRAQIINLLISLQRRTDVSYLFISHDLSVVHHISDVIAVMYLGKIVEISPKAELYENPMNPYTRVLLSAIPVPDPALEKKRETIMAKGEVPSAVSIPSGCRFHPRCPEALKKCRSEEPVFREVTPGHWAQCHLLN
jgi:oligopeptide transport system ATP-binding protein